MKKTYVVLGVFCALLMLFCGCKKTSYFEAKEDSLEQTTKEASDSDAEETTKEEAVPQNIYVYIYPKDEYDYVITNEPVVSEEQEGKVNLNTASQSDLMTLPGIGEAKANAIIAYRNENGGFRSIEELKNITGIKDGVYSKISDQIYVN